MLIVENDKSIKEINIKKFFKTTLYKYLFLILTFSVFVYGNGGPVGAKASVSSMSIVPGDIVELKIRARGSRADFPTIEQIDGTKVLSRHERVTNVHTYNHGQLERERTTLILTFAPEKDMTIPSYTVEIDGKAYHSNPIHIKVQTEEVSPLDRIFTVKLKANKESLVVGEAFLATVSFSLQHGMLISNKLKYLRPEFKGFFVERVEGEKDYDEGNYQVSEMAYILTPHSEGNYTLGPAAAKIGLHDGRKREGTETGFGTKVFQKASNTVNVEVLAKAKESDLVGQFSLVSKVDTQKVNANKPVNLSVTIEGEGSLIQFDIPRYELDGVTVYSNDAKVDVRVEEGKILSTYRKKFVFISDKDFSIPERRFTVYDPKTGKTKVLKIEAFNIDIKNAKARTDGTAVKASKITPASVSKAVKLKEKENIVTQNWQVLLLAFTLGAALFIVWHYLPKRKGRAGKESDALHILYSHVANDAEVEEMVRKLYARKNGDLSVEIDRQKLKMLLEKYT